MNAKETLQQIKVALGMEEALPTEEKVEVKLEQVTIDGGAIFEAEKFEAGFEVFIVNEEERIPVPVGEYLLPDDKILIVIEDGIIAEIKDKEAEKEEEAPTEEAPVKEEVEAKEEAPTTPKKVIESITKEQFFSEIKRLEELINAKQEPTELSVEEKVEEIKHSPEANVEKKEVLFAQQSGMQTTKDRVFNTLFN